jgi:phosphatidate phosphatase PAH1
MGRNPNRRDIGVGIRAENGRFQAKITSPAAVFKKNKENKDIDKDLSLSNNRGAVSKESGWPGISINKRGEIEIKETQEGLLIKITNSSNKKEKLNVSSNKRKASAIGVTTPTKESTNPGTEAKTNSEKGT